MKTINIYLPFFSGFYESNLENSDTGYCAIQNEVDEYYNRELNGDFNYDDFDFDYDKRHNDIAEAFVDAWKNCAPDFIKEVRFDRISSPRYYNFETDKLWVNIDLNGNWKKIIKNFIKDNYDWLKSKIKKDWSSYDGFISFMEDDIDSWNEKLFDEEDERYIITMIGYMMFHSDNNIREHIEYDVFDNYDIYDGYYVIPANDDVKNKLNELMENTCNN